MLECRVGLRRKLGTGRNHPFDRLAGGTSARALTAPPSAEPRFCSRRSRRRSTAASPPIDRARASFRPDSVLVINLVRAGLRVRDDELGDEVRDGQAGKVRAHGSAQVVEHPAGQGDGFFALRRRLRPRLRQQSIEGDLGLREARDRALPPVVLNT